MRKKKIVGKKTAWHDCMESKDKNAMTHSPVFADAKKKWMKTNGNKSCLHKMHSHSILNPIHNHIVY